MRSSRFLAAAVSAFLTAFAPQAPPAPRPDSFADLSARLLPTVVNIATTQTLKAPQGGGIPNLPPDSPLSDLFKNLLGPQAPRHITSLGSGFVIDPTGYIVTNNHVIEGADTIAVTLDDGETLKAKVVGRDTKTDLALLKVSPRRPLPAAHFGDSETARIGDWVIAIGNPFGLGSTVTQGIVSARNRIISEGDYDDFIQTDAPINRGNSGGPLFDMAGNVVGVNSAIFSPSESGGSVGIGFAIPSNLARDIVEQIREFGAPRRGWVGVSIQQVTDEAAERLHLTVPAGALVTQVTSGGPAARAGIVPGDLIASFDGKQIGDSRMLPGMVAGTPIGKTVQVGLLRNGRKLTLRLTVQRLKEGPPPKPAASKVKKLS